MWARRIHEHKDTSQDQNFFLDLILGLVAAAQRVRTLRHGLRGRRPAEPPTTERHGRRPAEPPTTERHGRRPAEPPMTELHGLDAFLLGVASFARTAEARVQGVALDPEAAPASESAPPEPKAPARDLLL